MTSDDLMCLADRLAGYALADRAVEPKLAAVIAYELLKHAENVAMMETLPFDVTKEVANQLLEAWPEWPIVPVATQARQ